MRVWTAKKHIGTQYFLKKSEEISSIAETDVPQNVLNAYSEE